MIFINDCVGNDYLPGMIFIWRVTTNGESCNISEIQEIRDVYTKNKFNNCFCFPYNFVRLGKLQKPISLWKYDYYQAENMRIYDSSLSQYVDVDVRNLKLVCPLHKLRESKWQIK